MSADPATAPTTYLAGLRAGLDSLAPVVAAWLAEQVGGQISSSQIASGGMSTSFAGMVRGADGAVFAKAGQLGANPFADAGLRREIDFHRVAPTLPHVPALLGSAELVEADQTWLVAAFEAAPGVPAAHPWRADELWASLDAWQDLTLALPELVHLGGDQVTWRSLFQAWPQLLADLTDPWHPEATTVAADEVPTRDIGHWLAPSRAVLERTEPLVLGHLDLRADNLIIGRDVDDQVSGVWFADWAHPTATPAWVDPALLVADAAGSGADLSTGGPIDLAELWRGHPLTTQWPVSLLALTCANLAAFLHLRRNDRGEFSHKGPWARSMSEHLIVAAESLTTRD